MPTYVTLFELTQNTKENFREFSENIQAGEELVESMGGELKGLYFGFGPYDAVSIVEVPDSKTMAQMDYLYEGQGEAETTVFEVFDADQTQEIIEEI